MVKPHRMLLGVERRTTVERARAMRSATPPLRGPDRPEDRRLRVAVAVPARDEAAAIGGVLRSVPQDSIEVRYRSFVCDDGSMDDTGAIALDAGATVLRHSINLGIGASLTTALEAARTWDPDIIVQLASDGQDDPTLIPQLVDPILQGDADYVIASRFLTGAVGIGPVRRVGVRFYSGLIRFLVGLRVTDVTSGFRAFRADVYSQLSIRSNQNWAVEMALRAGLNRVRTVEVPVPYRPRIGGRSQFVSRRLFFLYHLRAILQVFRAYTAPRGPLVPRVHARPSAAASVMNVPVVADAFVLPAPQSAGSRPRVESFGSAPASPTFRPTEVSSAEAAEVEM